VVFSTFEPSSAIRAFYQSELPISGWTIVNTEPGDEDLVAMRGEEYLKINITVLGGATYVQICQWPQRPQDNDWNDCTWDLEGQDFDDKNGTNGRNRGGC
jgi:hypothetical protein